jgi:type IV pilus assembly protein PilP
MDVKKLGALAALTLAILQVGCGEEVVTAPTVDEYAADRARVAANLAKSQAAPQAAVAQHAGGTAQGQVESNLEAGFGSVAENYIYEAIGKRDPFRSFKYGSDEVASVGFGPLGDYELGQLSVVAVVWDTGKPRALIADPGGRSFVIREGSQIGKNNGRVIHIGDNLVLVKETYVDFAGDETTKDVEMRIRRSQGG